MKLALLLLLMVFAVSPVQAQPKKKKSGLERVLKSMFQPRTPTIRTVTKKKIVYVQKAPTPPKTFAVDPQWMARYWELEAAWDYPIPEDDLIKWKDGKYIVPIVVQKHHEDMVNTPRRTSAAANPEISHIE